MKSEKLKKALWKLALVIAAPAYAIYLIAMALYGGDVDAMKDPTDKEIVVLGAMFIAFIAFILYSYFFLGWRP